MPVVTIRGFMGSGAQEIGTEVASLLHADYVDREIIAKVAARLNRQEQDVMAKEMPPSTLLGRIAEALERTLPFGVGFEGAYLPAWEIPLNDARYFQALESVVKELARSRSIVILARGSHLILKDDPKALHVMVVASREARLRRVMQDLKLDQAAAKQEIARRDSTTREFIKRYFKTEVEDSVKYDLVINSERLGFQAAISLIVQALSLKEQTKGAPS